MIDVEIDVFDKVANMLDGKIPDGTLSGVYVRRPATFPHASIREIENIPIKSKATTDCIEEYSLLTYEVQVFSNLLVGSKLECRHIAKLIDEALGKLNFHRITLREVPNMDDATIYRMIGRYEVKVDKQGHLYY